MSTPSPEFRVQEIKTRHLEIVSTLADWKRDYLVSGIPRSRGERATLEAEDAALALELRLIGDAANKAKVERRQRENGDVLNHLTNILTERGQEHLIEEARQRAAAQCGEERALKETT